jgi:hypothetical protein
MTYTMLIHGCAMCMPQTCGASDTLTQQLLERALELYHGPTAQFSARGFTVLFLPQPARPPQR